MNTVTSADWTTIAFDTFGDGPPVILVGGAFQHRANDKRTEELAKLLSSQFTVYHYDRRGRGDSTDTPPYAPAREIEDLVALLDYAGAPACVFGMSSGAVLALEAVAAGAKVRKIALYEIPLMVDDTRPGIAEDYLDRLRALVAQGRREDAVGLFLTEAVGVPAEYLAPMRQDPSWAGLVSVAHTLPYDGALMDGLDAGGPPQRWAAVTVPALVIDGGASPPWFASAAQALAAVLPDSRRQTLAGQQHAVDPAVIAPMLAEFFA